MANAEMLTQKKDRKCWSTDTHHLPRLYTLILRMTVYLKHSIVSSLSLPPSLPLPLPLPLPLLLPLSPSLYVCMYTYMCVQLVAHTVCVGQ